MNYATSDPALLPLIQRFFDPEDRQHLLPLVTELGQDLPDRLAQLADDADKNPPILEQYDRDGNRVDRIRVHESYRELQKAAYEEYALAALSHRPVHGWKTRPPHLVKYVMSYLFMQTEYGLGCPVNMTDAAARTLRKFGDPSIFDHYTNRLTSTDPNERFTGAMFMTEVQAGTDIAKTEAQAVTSGEAEGGWLLSGKKWFTSNADADVVLTLARFPGGDPESSRGVGLFMMPKRLPDGSRNSYFIERLKDKFGTRSMPSGEVLLDSAWALQVGQLDRGFRQMAEMVNTSRLSNAMRSTALMRRAVHESIQHTTQRVIFGKHLIEHPLMRMTLLPLQLETEASLSMVFFAGDQLQQSDAGCKDAEALIRVLTPIAKHSICKKARWVTGEAMEIRGGNGYIEDFPNARLVRDSHLGSIWEGSSNVIALDVLRCMRKFNAHHRIAETMTAKLQPLFSAETAWGAQKVSDIWEDLNSRGNALLDSVQISAEALIGRYTDAVATAIMATLLLEQAQVEIDATSNFRKLVVAEAYIRYAIDSHPEGNINALNHLEALLKGGHLDREHLAESVHSPALSTS